MAIAYLLLIIAVLLSLKKKMSWVYSILWIDFLLILWVFVRHMTLDLGLNL